MSIDLIGEDVAAIAQSLYPHCSALNGRRIFLTGGTGFFGKWLLYSFLEFRKARGLDASMVVLSRDPAAFLSANPLFGGRPGLEFIQGDVRTFDIGRVPPCEFVIHGATAASAKLEQENPGEMYSVITAGTRHVLDCARQCSARRFLFVSSGAVYGPQPPDLVGVPETYRGEPVTAYGKGKRDSERMSLDVSSGRFECVIARPFAFVGPHLPLDTHFAIGNFIRDCLENRPIIIQGDGTPLRSYLYAADLVEWLWALLLRGEHARAYNVGSDEPISICDLAHRVRDCAGTKNEISVRGKRVEGAAPAQYVPSVDRAKTELGLERHYSLADAICRTLAWHRGDKEEGVAEVCRRKRLNGSRGGV